MAQGVNDYVTRLYEDFGFFLEETMWYYYNFGPSWVQLDMADWLQNGPSRRIVIGYRGLAKTTITEIYVLWRLFRNKDIKIVLISKAASHARNSLKAIRAMIDSVPFLRKLVPVVRVGYRDSSEAVDVGDCQIIKDPSLAAFGIEGQITGTRPDLIIADDIETKQNTITAANRQTLKEGQEEMENIVNVGADIVMLGTYHHTDTLYHKLTKVPEHVQGDKARPPYAIRAYPYLYPVPGETIKHIAPEVVRRLREGEAKPGTPLWPERHTLADLDGKAISSTTRAMQYQCRTDLGEKERFPLRQENLIVFDADRKIAPVNIAWGRRNGDGSTELDIDPIGFEDHLYGPAFFADKWKPYTSIKAQLDSAGNAKRDGDKTALAIAGELNGYIYLLAVLTFDGGIARTETLEAIVLALRDYGARELHVETNFGGEALITLIRPIIQKHSVQVDGNGNSSDRRYPEGWHCAVEGHHVTTMKEGRIIDTLGPITGAHRLVVTPEIARNQRLMYQYTNIVRERKCLAHEDELDAVEGVCSQFIAVLDQDAAKAEAITNEEKRQAELEKAWERMRGPEKTMLNCLTQPHLR